jgi:CRISPR-associated endonuclease/helicase Cas3
MNVLLGRWEGDRLQPWIAGPHGWAYSTVRVAERLIARTAEPPPRQRKAAVAQLMQMLPNKGQWSVLLPLDKTPQGWVGTALSAPQRYGVGRELNWIYDVRTGLRQLANLAAQEDEE